MRLSILIASLRCRQKMLDRLLAILRPQCPDGVEIGISQDDGEFSIGVKRQELLEKSQGDYVCFVDDDDMVAADYVANILEALKLNPDCVGFIVDRWVNGEFDAQAIHSIRYQHYHTRHDDGLRLYERTPNHLNPIKRELALKTGFVDKNRGEDSDFAIRVYPLLQSEVFIPKPIYHYLFTTMDRRDEFTNDMRTQTPTPEQWFAERRAAV